MVLAIHYIILKLQLTEREEFVDLYDMQQLEGNEQEVKKEKGLKFLTPNKLLPRISILLAQTTARNNSKNRKKKITKNVCSDLIKSL